MYDETLLNVHTYIKLRCISKENFAKGSFNLI